jgi:hypothetical protein
MSDCMAGNRASRALWPAGRPEWSAPAGTEGLVRAAGYRYAVSILQADSRIKQYHKEGRALEIGWAQDTQAQGFLREAEELLARPKPPSSK